MQIPKTSGSPTAPAASPPSPPAAAESPKRTFVEVLGERHGTPPGATPSVTPPRSPHHPASAPSPELSVRKVMQGALNAEKQIESILRAAAQGKTFTPAELIAMQAQVFRYSQTVEVISRATDKLIGAVKQTLSTQV